MIDNTNIAFVDNECEKYVIGCLLTDTLSIEKVEDILIQDMFYSEKLGYIYKAINNLYARGKYLDMVTITAELNKMGKLSDIGGAYEITILATSVSNTASIQQNAMRMSELYVKRNIHLATTICQNELKSEEFETEDTVERLNKSVDGAFNAISRNEEIVPVLQSTYDALKAYEDKKKAQARGEVYGIDTGFPTLNKLTGGWQNSWFCILGARPAMGKTSVMLKHARSAAEQLKNVVIFSLEMSHVELTNKLICAYCEIDSIALSNGQMNEKEEIDYYNAGERIKKLPITIIDKANISISKIRTRAKQLKKRGQCDIIFIDYLQLIKSSVTNGSRENEVSDISRTLKIIAKELNVPIICLSQLNRECEKRPDKKPLLSDLRESGAIEQDADMISFIHRPEYYKMDIYEDEPSNNLVVYNIAKFRHGQIGEILSHRNYNYTNFTELGHGEIQEIDNSAVKPNENFYDGSPF